MKWSTAKLKELGEIVGGGTPSTKLSSNFGGEIPWITPKDLSAQSARYMIRGERNISNIGFQSSSAKLVPPGTIIISSRAPIGLISIALDSLTTNQGCRSFVPGPSVDSLFMYYLLKTMKDEFIRHANGSTFLEISGSALGEIVVKFPSLEAQQAIAAMLGALDDKIDSNRRLITLAEELGSSIFLQNVSQKIDLSKLANVTMGNSPPGSTFNTHGDGAPFYQGIRDFGFRFPRRRVWTTAPKRMAAQNDTLLSVRAPVGQINRAQEACCIGRGLAAISSAHSSTIYFALKNSDYVWAQFQGEGTVFGAINKSDLARIAVPWPDDQHIDEIERQLKAIDARIETAVNEINTLTELRDAMLPQLLSGRIQIGL